MYGLEIQKLVARKELVTDPEDRIKLLQQAIQLSDSNKDTEWSIDLRLDLMEEEIFGTQHHELSIQAISWVIGAYEQDPTVIEEKDFLWQYKWVVHHIIGSPDISKQQEKDIIADFSKRLQRNNYSLRPVYESYLGFYTTIGLEEEAKKYLACMQAEAVDDMSNCRACEQDTIVHYHLSFSGYDKAKAEAENILNGKLACHQIPARTLASLTEELTELNRLEEAKAMYEKGRATLFKDPFTPGRTGDLLDLAYFLSKTDNKAAWELIDKHSSNVEPTAFSKYSLALQMLAIIKNTNTSEIKVKLPTWLPFYNTTNTYPKEILFKGYYNLAKTILDKTAQREGNPEIAAHLDTDIEKF